MPVVAAMARKWLRADRPVWTAFASSSAPASCRGRVCSAKGFPFTVAVPEVGASRPRMSRIVVDLPAPLGPRNPVTTPGRTVKLKSSTASLSPYRLVSC